MKTYLKHRGFCGMESVTRDFENEEEGRQAAARFIRRRRKQGFEVVKLSPYRWEILEPEDSAMIPDLAGILSLALETPKQCRECGCDYYESENPNGCDCACTFFAEEAVEE